MPKNFLSGKALKISLHILVWFLALSIPYLFINTTVGERGFFLGRFYTRLFFNGAFFYISYLLLVPKLYLQNRKTLYLLITGTLIIFFYFADKYIVDWIFPDYEIKKIMDIIRDVLSERSIDFKPPSPEIHIISAIALNILLAGSALGLRLTETLDQRDQKQKELERQHLTSELTMLKNQISPHFFFNTLNNIYSFTETNPEKSRQAILKLSRMMRYLLYDTNTDSIPLSKEIIFMNDYIDLMRMRLTSKVKIETSLPDEPSTNTISVPPLLFISFVENAFKHGISYREPSFIEIRLEYHMGEIRFHCLNSRFDSQNQDYEPGGIGLENIRKRLDLLFNGKYKLLTEAKQNEYLVNLTITL